jgi:hypothetical protein
MPHSNQYLKFKGIVMFFIIIIKYVHHRVYEAVAKNKLFIVIYCTSGV